MKLKRLFLFGFLISTKILNAQTDFRPGYVIKSTGDTLFGQIDYCGDLLMSHICKFRDTDNAIKEFSPNDILEFRFLDSKYYVTKEIDNKKTFLEFLIKGKVSIYYMRNEKGDHYYIDKEGVRLTEIPYEEGIKYVDNNQVFYKSNKHIGLLKYYMQEAPQLQSRIQSIKILDHKNLIKLAEDYHNAVCKDEKCIIYERRVPLICISIEPFAGFTMYDGYNKCIKELGGYLYFCSPRISENFFFKTGVAYQTITEAGENLNVYKIPIQIQYLYGSHRIQPKLSGGFNMLSAKLNDYKGLSHTLSLNGGLDYKISNRLNLSTAFNSDFTPIVDVVIYKDFKFDIISYSFIVGLRINL